MYLLSFFKKGDTIQGGTLFKRGHYLRKYGTYLVETLCDGSIKNCDLCYQTKMNWLVQKDS